MHNEIDFNLITKIEQIGYGAHGKVYKYKFKDKIYSNTLSDKIYSNTLSDKLIAIKKFITSKDFPDDLTVNEINSLALLNDNLHIIKCIGVNLSNRILAFNLATSNLHKFIRLIPFEVRIKYINDIINQLITGLSYIHNQQIIHGDIKPGNILVDYHVVNNTIESVPTIYYADFGSAVRQFNYVPKIKYHKHDFICTESYKPPELFNDELFYTEKVDIWQLGATIYHYICKSPLFDSMSEYQNLKQLSQMLQIQQEIPTMLLLESTNKIDIIKQLKLKLSQQYFEMIPEKTIHLLESMLQICPTDRMSVKTSDLEDFNIFSNTPIGIPRGVILDKCITLEIYYKIINWIFDRVDDKQTLLITLDILDRFLANESDIKSNLQIIACGCIYLAYKFNNKTDVSYNYLKNKLNDVSDSNLIRYMVFDICKKLNYILINPEIDKLFRVFENYSIDEIKQIYILFNEKQIQIMTLDYDKFDSLIKNLKNN